MSTVLYCSKVNLVSGHIFEIYNQKELLYKVLGILHGDISSDISYVVEDKFLNDNDEIVTKTITYKLSISEKTNDYVYGHLCKDSILYYKTFNEQTKEAEKHSTPYTESVQFYFDVYKETIVYHTTNRMGYQEFNTAITGIFNKIMEKNNREFRFEVVLRTEGIGVDDIENELKSIQNIYELSFQFQSPNPDEETLDRIQENGERFLDTMQSAHATRVSRIFSTKGGAGLNLDSDIIKENIENIKSMNNIAGGKEAISKGYISVEAIDANGKKYTTKHLKPIKTVVNNLDHFVRECKRIISRLN